MSNIIYLDDHRQAVRRPIPLEARPTLCRYICPQCHKIISDELGCPLRAALAGKIYACHDCHVLLWPVDEESKDERLQRWYRIDLSRRPDTYWSDSDSPDESPIAWIHLNTSPTTFSYAWVFILARKTRTGITYLVREENGIEVTPEIESSELPLTLGELISLIDNTQLPGLKIQTGFPSGLVMGYYSSVQDGWTVDDAITFAKPLSAFYPDHGKWYRREAYQWKQAYLE
jgi:hypothetical protein